MAKVENTLETFSLTAEDVKSLLQYENKLPSFKVFSKMRELVWLFGDSLIDEDDSWLYCEADYCYKDSIKVLREIDLDTDDLLHTQHFYEKVEDEFTMYVEKLLSSLHGFNDQEKKEFETIAIGFLRTEWDASSSRVFYSLAEKFLSKEAFEVVYFRTLRGSIDLKYHGDYGPLDYSVERTAIQLIKSDGWIENWNTDTKWLDSDSAKAIRKIFTEHYS